MSAAYERLLEECLGAGLPIDAIGLQSHMHQGIWGEDKTLSVLERFGRFGLPLHFTETTILSGHFVPPEVADLNDYTIPEWPSTPDGEASQLQEVLRHYKTLLADPAVAAITWWDLADGGWLGAPAGLVRADCSPKPAYAALLALVKGDWWLPPTTMATDETGRLHVSGFLGDYELSHAGTTVPFRLDRPGRQDVEVSV
jgi:GH35 family endo-1,4-beta-xylanase